MKQLGIDIGAYSLKYVLLDENQDIIDCDIIPHHNHIHPILQDLYKTLTDEIYNISITGSMASVTNVDSKYIINEITAIQAGLNSHTSNHNSCIYIGAAHTYYITSDQIKENSNCSAGTGAFFEEQANRLNIEINQISDLVNTATSIPQIAGRCSVFSKTDMIHRMQEGYSTADILKGLCYALVRNYKSNILGNKPINTPVYLAGGVIQNSGVVSAFQDVFKLQSEDFILDDMSDYIQAYGAALLAQEKITPSELQLFLDSQPTFLQHSNLAPLKNFVDENDKKIFTTYELTPGDCAYLGIDIGSTSVNFVLIDDFKRVIYYSYIKNLGKPMDIVSKEIEKIQTKFSEINIKTIAITGSGREYIGNKIGANLIINEITAQAEGALLTNQDIDTIFEIGGQDSKYMEINDSKMIDFEMNKICAAGTGAFLEEQIKKLGISMDEFLNLALSSENPCELGDRCTVFIESSINKALGAGHPLSDVCAGLAYAIASNYLNRVVHNKPIGNKIAIQGGIAHNEAVICAFRALTKKSIHTSNYFSVTGALGAASLSMQQSNLVFNKEKNQKLNEILFKSSEKSFLGDYTQNKVGSGKQKIGIPRVVFLHKMFPLFYKIFSKLGYDVILSPLTTKDIINKANEYVTAEVCYPIKLIYGHVAWIIEQDIDYIFLPRLYTIKHEGSKAREDFACMYMQTFPLLLSQAFDFEKLKIKIISPELSINFGKKYMLKSILSIADTLGIPKVKMLPATIQGMKKLLSHTKRLEEIGNLNLKDTSEPIFVLVSRVYNIIDPALNMGIEQYLNKLGCRIIHLEHLAANYMYVHHDYENMYWPFGQHILTGLKIIKENTNLYPIYITNHGCGPDTAIQHFFQNEMEGREYLQLEVDEHASQVGIITRLEAFLYTLQPQKPLNNTTTTNTIYTNTTALIPDFGMYTKLIEKYVVSESRIIYAKPLEEHHSYNFAFNKEYFSLQLMLEEILNTITLDETYTLYFPIDMGSETFGQYALLIYQELCRRGYKINLHTFYLEDIIKSDKYMQIYQDMIDIEMSNLNPEDVSQHSYIIGEPLCVYKESAGDKSVLDNHLLMPLSEALLFHLLELRQYKPYKNRLSQWLALHDEAMVKTQNIGLYSALNDILDACKNRLDFMEGNFAKYRFGKLFTLDAKLISNCNIINSSEENSGIILKNITENYKDVIPVKTTQFNIDFSHDISNKH